MVEATDQAKSTKSRASVSISFFLHTGRGVDPLGGQNATPSGTSVPKRIGARGEPRPQKIMLAVISVIGGRRYPFFLLFLLEEYNKWQGFLPIRKKERKKNRWRRTRFKSTGYSTLRDPIASAAESILKVSGVAILDYHGQISTVTFHVVKSGKRSGGQREIPKKKNQYDTKMDKR